MVKSSSGDLFSKFLKQIRAQIILCGGFMEWITCLSSLQCLSRSCWVFNMTWLILQNCISNGLALQWGSGLQVPLLYILSQPTADDFINVLLFVVLSFCHCCSRGWEIDLEDLIQAQHYFLGATKDAVDRGQSIYPRGTFLIALHPHLLPLFWPVQVC